VILVHGYGEHSGRYAHLAGRLAEGGFEVAAIDLRGHGLSEGKPISVVRFDDYIEDVHRLIVHARERWTETLPVVMLGHSMGSLVATRYALAHQHQLAGLVLSAPAVLSPTDVAPATIRIGRLLARVAPDLGTVNLPVHLISRDPAVVAAYNADPLVHRRRVRARLGAEMLRVIDEVGPALAQLTIPVLLLQGTADALVDPGAARFVHDSVSSPDRTLQEYACLYHEIFNEPEREQVIDDLLRWLESRS
jgi:alpha-beta hydrolase superfamily lysophospholipase